MRVLCVASAHDIHHVRHIDVLSKAGVDLRLVDYATDFAKGGTHAASHVPWPKSGRRTLAKLMNSRVANAIGDWLTLAQLKSLWRRWQADVCHVHWVDERLLTVARAGLRPLVVTAYGSDMNWTQLPSYDPERLDQVKRGLAEVDLFVADSEDMIAIADELVGRRLPSMLLPIGIDTGKFRPGYEAEARAWLNELQIPRGSPVVLSPRAIRRNYRHVEIVRALARAVHDHGFAGHMIFKAYYSDADYVEEVVSAARECGVRDRIRLIDEAPYERLPVLYAMSDLIVNYPILDAFPVTFLEAAACETPILTHRREAYQSNGMAEFLNFVEHESESALGAGIAALGSDAAARARAEVSRRHVVEHYDESAFAGALVDAYRRLTDR